MPKHSKIETSYNFTNQLERVKQKVTKQEYNACVVALIRAKYTKDDENAIIRKKLANLDSGEFDAFNTYVERNVGQRLKLNIL